MTSDEVASDAALNEERRTMIGGSDIGPLLRMSRFGLGPLDVAVDKIVGRRKTATPQMRLGTLLQPVLAQMFTEETGVAMVPAPVLAVRHPVLLWAGAHGDFVGAAVNWILEVKFASHRSGWGEPGSDQVPPDILLQCQWQMMCFKTKECHVAALVAGEFQRFLVPRNDELIGLSASVAGAFWDMLQRGEFPAPDWSDPRTPDLIGMLYRPDGKITCELGHDAAALAEQYESAGIAYRAAEKARDLAKGKLVFAMKDASVGHLPGGEQEVRRSLVQNRITVSKRRK